MNLFQLSLRNISGNSFRSAVIFLCALLVAGFALAMTLIIQGAQESLTLANLRLGADILVVPYGLETKVQNSLVMGTPTVAWMPSSVASKIASIPDVQTVSPQLFLGTMKDAPCCAVSAMFMIAFDPQTDFTVSPWLEQRLGRNLNSGEAIGGTFVYSPNGDGNVEIYGSNVKLVGNLEPTGTGLDQTMFITFDTAYDLAAKSASKAVEPMPLPPNSISAVLVRLRPGASPQNVSMEIIRRVQNISAIDSSNLFQSYRKQINGLTSMVSIALVVALVLSIAVIDLIFTMAVNERRREIAVLRALGATRGTIFFSFLFEANLLAVAGGVTGAAIAALAVYLFRNLLMSSLDIPFLLPSPLALVPLIVVGMVGVVLSVSLSVMLPAFKTSRQEPALAMRE